MEEEINREEVYSFSYTNREDGRQITASFHPLGDTWEGVLPEIRSFLQGVGYEFGPSQVLTFVDQSERKAIEITPELVRQEREYAGRYLEGFTDGFAEAVAIIRKNVIQQLNLQDAQILNNYLNAMTPL